MPWSARSTSSGSSFRRRLRLTAEPLRASLEVADIFRSAGPVYRAAHAGHLSLAQLKVMAAIENCRTAALGGHIEACVDCGHWRIAYNSCRNRHCPKCQGAAARAWLEEREADLLPVGYFHVVFTLPAEIAAVALQNKSAIYDLLFRAASETMLTIAADPRHLGARIGITAVLHTWGSAMTHHPHVHMIVPGGGIAPDNARWIASHAPTRRERDAFCGYALVTRNNWSRRLPSAAQISVSAAPSPYISAVSTSVMPSSTPARSAAISSDRRSARSPIFQVP